MRTLDGCSELLHLALASCTLRYLFTGKLKIDTLRPPLPLLRDVLSLAAAAFDGQHVNAN